MPTSNFNLIGITGHKGHGKDTACLPLQSPELGWKKIAFAQPLKEAVSELFDIPAEYLHDPELKEKILERYNMSPRKIMQDFGQNVRSVSPNHWVDAWYSLMKGAGKVVTPDVRYPNELEAIRKYGGVMIRIVRKDLINTDTHISESFVETMEVDLEIENIPGHPEIMQQKLLDFIVRGIKND